MAQWMGQFTGNSHATKIEDLETTLRHAINVYREVRERVESQTKEKAIRKLAEKLFTARLKYLKARLYEAEPVMENKEERRQRKRVETLRQQEVKVRSDGVNGILLEFGALDLIVQV
jgi:hypothetical protein